MYKKGGNGLAMLNAANEVAIEKFCKNKISFLDIPKLINPENYLDKFFLQNPTIDDLFQSDKQIRDFMSRTH